MAYEIPWAPLDISPGVRLLLDTMKSNRQQDIAQQQADTQSAYAKNAESRESAMEARNKQTFEQGQLDRRTKVMQSASELRRMGRASEADTLLKMHGITAAPEMRPGLASPAEVVTPMSVMQRMQAPAPAQPQPVGQHSGSPAVDPRMTPAEAPPSVDPMDETANLMPLTVPGDIGPAKPTGATTFKGPRGEDLGRFDPAEEAAMRTQAAGKFGAFDEKYAKMAEVLMSMPNADPQKVGAVIAGAIQHDADTKARNDQRITEENAKRTFTAEENEKYKNAGLTFEQMMQLAKERGGATAARQGLDLKEQAANRQDIGSLRSEVRDWKKTTVQLPLDTTNYKLLHQIVRNVESKNPIQQAEGLESILRVFKGGNPTAATQALITGHMSGKVGELQGYVQKMLTGGYGEEQLANIRQAAKDALQENRERRERAMQSFDQKFTNSQTWQNFAAPISEERNAMMTEFGEDPSVSEGLSGPVLGPKNAKPSKPKAAKASTEANGATRFVNGRKMVKVGPNHWEPAQ